MLEIDVFCNGCKKFIKTVDKEGFDLHHKDYCIMCQAKMDQTLLMPIPYWNEDMELVRKLANEKHRQIMERIEKTNK